MFQGSRIGKAVLRAVGVVAILTLCSSASWSQEPRPDQAPEQRRERIVPGAYLGITISLSDRAEPGVVVREVTPDSPAAKAGLKNGDRVVKIDNQEVGMVPHFLQTVGGRKAGDKVTLHIVREGNEQDIAVTLGERPAGMTMQPPWVGRGGMIENGQRMAFLGVQTQPISPELKSRLKLNSDTGVVVTEVVPNSPAAGAGIRNDDVISAIDDRAIQNPDQLRETVQQMGTGKEVTVKIMRGTENMSVKAKLADFPFNLPRISRFQPSGGESFFDPNDRMAALERRIEELEKRVKELEKKHNP